MVVLEGSNVSERQRQVQTIHAPPSQRPPLSASSAATADLRRQAGSTRRAGVVAFWGAVAAHLDAPGANAPACGPLRIVGEKAVSIAMSAEEHAAFVSCLEGECHFKCTAAVCAKGL